MSGSIGKPEWAPADGPRIDDESPAAPDSSGLQGEPERMSDRRSSDEVTALPARGVGGWVWIKVLTVVAITVPVAIVQGHFVNRWDTHTDLQQIVDTVHQTPTQLGSWHMVAEGKPLSPSVQSALHLAGHVHRIYEQAESGQRLAVLILVGPGGPLVRHPPELCYRSLDRKLLESRRLEFSANGRPQQFQLLRYQGESLARTDFCVAYGFGCERLWSVPAMPRLVYGGKPALLKIQVLIDDPLLETLDPSAIVVDFLQQLLPTVNF